MLAEYLLGRQSLPLLWSTEVCGNNFWEEYKVFEGDSILPKVGCHRILFSDPEIEHVLHWEATEGIVCLREFSTKGQQLSNSCVCIRLGASDLLEMSVFSKGKTSTGQNVTILCFVQQDGTIRVLELISDATSSILEPLVMSNEGGLVNFGGTVSNNIPTMGSSNHRRQHGVKTVAVKAAGSAVTAYAGAVQTVPADRDIESAAWSSADCLLLGLSHGDVLLVKLKRSQDEDISSSSLQVHERMLRDRGSGLQALWSEFMGGAADSNCDTICLATQAASALAVNRSGELRQWNVGAEILVSQTSLFDLLDAVGAVDALAPIRVQGSTTNSSGHGQNGTIDRNIHLQECVVRLAEDRVPAPTSASAAHLTGSKYLLGALAVLPEESEAGGFGVVGQSLSGQAIPANHQRWQILLVAWREASEASVRPSEKLKLVAQPIKFPIGSLVVSHSSPVATATTAVVAGNIRDSTLIDYRYSAAALVDLQLSVDAERGVAIVVTVWRAVATRLDRDEHRHEEVVFEGLVCRSVLQLADLRAQEYTPPGSTGVGPRRAQELLAADNMEIVLHSAAHDRYRLFAEDRVILRQAEDAWGSIDLADQKSLARAEGHLKATMLQRVFLPRRYSSRVICSAYDAFRARNRNLWANAADVTGQGGKSAGASVSLLDKKTSIPELSQLVLQLCEGTARQRFGGAGAAVLGAPSLTPFPFSPQRAGQHHQQQLQQGEQELRWRKQYLQYLGDSFSEFLGVCEASSHKVEALNAGCSTVCGVRSGRDGLIVKALRNGDIAVVSALTTMEAVLSEGNLLPLHSEALLSATSMLSLIEERFVADDALRHDLLELDCLLVKFLQTGDISSEASVEWIPHYFASLTPGLRGLLPQLLDLIQEEGGNGEFSSYDALVQLCALPHAGKGNSQDLLSSGGDAFDELLRQSSAALEGTAGAGVGADATASPSSIGAQDILCQQALRAIRQSLLRSKLALALLALVVEAGQPLLHTETYSAIRDKCIPAITHNVLHLSMLLWLDSLRPTDNHMLVQEVELAAIFPLSAAFTGAGTAVAGKVKVESSKPDSNASVFENFMRTLRNRTSLSRVFSSAQLSTHSELSGFLFRSGQYVSLSRWAALTQLVLAPSAADSLSDGGGGVHPHGTEQLLTCIGRCRAHITRLTAEYLELLRCQWYHLQRVPLSTAGSPTGPLAAIKQKMHDLLTATTELDTLADSVLSNVLLTGDATLSPMAGDRRRSLHGADVARGMVQHLKTLWFDSVTRMRSANFACSLCQSKRVHNRLEGLLALADAVMYVGTVGKGSTLLALLADSSLPGQDAEGAAKELLDNRLSELCRTLHLSTVSGVLEMLDRALFFLPRKEGSALAMEGALLLAEHVAATLDAVTQRSGLDRQACSQVLLTELHGAWSRVFEYALLHGERYTEALDALMRVAELEEQRVLDADALSSTTSSSFSAPAAVVPWRGCLRTLVAQACDMGKLGWLCSIPDRQLQGFAKQGFSLCAVIASTLEELAVTLDTPSAMNFNEANYFECLFVFHLSRRNYHDAARVMHKLLERKSITGPSSAELEAQVGYSAASLAALEALPVDQRFVLHKLSAGRNVSGPGVGTGMQCLDERQLSLLFAKKSGAAKLTSTAFPPMQHDVATAGSGAVDQLVVALCNAGRLHDALSLAIACARSAAGNSAASSSSPDNNTSFSAYLLSAPIIALSKQCLVGGRSPASVASASQRDFFLHAPFLAGCVPSDKAAAEEDSEGRHQWRYLCALLSSLRRADHCGGVHVYEVALRALLFFHKQQSAPTSDAPLPLPRTLVDALAGLPSPVSVNADNTDSCSRAGDPSLLLRLLLEFDCREEACSLATRLLSAANDELLQGPAPRSVSVAVAAADTSVQDLCGWLPYPTLDLLIAHCELPHECSSPELLKRERDALVKLKDTLEQHFSLWLFR